MPKPKRHKRKGPKSTRSGCLMCKPHKRQGVDDPPKQEKVARIQDKEVVHEMPIIRGRVGW